ncbi:hypothetical protein [Fuerstiella marisgermanici]|uniref:Uncharacterized protein n=1 Tax=Fuerstiella marisgermanici TaxID=1891926 RepID=A0A1P8WIK8_9PLAN|nr:hypothetical protein [Fuerstiella marisgermanici]APZ93886.1 hypothetical protein Fuma_03504 [Fuerstiella marisgermanici]
MHSNERLSRRAWFRLRPPKPAPEPTPSTTREATVGQTAPGLAEVAHPPNHDGMDMSELPPMREAILAAEQVEELFADIEQLGTDILLMQRSSRTAQANVSQADAARNLQVAKTSLLSGGIARVQIRYRWQDTLWIDTLEAKPGGYRIIRIAHAGH